MKLYKKHDDIRLSFHLHLKEVDCHCSNPFCRHTVVDPQLPVHFECLRELAGNKPIKINSAYRCPEHNFSVGGVQLSQHLIGRAIDMAPPTGLQLEDFKLLAKQAGFNFIYIDKDKNFMHADIRQLE